jgi:hypothetical protein
MNYFTKHLSATGVGGGMDIFHYFENIEFFSGKV